LIRDRYGIKLAIPNMGLCLERWSFMTQKLTAQAYERLPAATKKRIEEECPTFASCCKVEGAEGLDLMLVLHKSHLAAQRIDDRLINGNNAPYKVCES
jgi:hypothetical protein